jgi:polyisoprenoid-binding protein YceI
MGAADAPVRHRLVPFAAAALGAAMLLGLAGSVHAQDEASAEGIDGSWLVDTSFGTFDEDLTSGSWVGFRVAEVLNPGGEAEAIGRTPLVRGHLDVSGTTIESAVIEADLTGIISDQRRREDAIQDSLGTGEFPTATFVSSGPVDLGAVPVDGVPFSAEVPGTLTIRDVSQEVTLQLDAQRAGDTVVVVGTLPVDFTSFGVTMPTAPIVVSVEDAGDLEWQLFFTRSSDEASAAASLEPGAEASADPSTES